MLALTVKVSTLRFEPLRRRVTDLDRSSFQLLVLIGQKWSIHLSGAFLLSNGINKAGGGTAISRIKAILKLPTRRLVENARIQINDMRVLRPS